MHDVPAQLRRVVHVYAIPFRVTLYRMLYCVSLFSGFKPISI